MANGWGGSRPNSGRKPKPRPLDPLLLEALQQIRRDIETKLAETQRQETWVLVLRRLAAIERRLGMTDLHIPSRHTRRRPLG